MPLYEYECLSCHEVTESLRKEEVKHITCPKCGDVARRQISASSIRIKGYSAANGYAQLR
jgi:putative FmdB family regulatory protein